MSALGDDYVCEMKVTAYRRMEAKFTEILSQDSRGIEATYYALAPTYATMQEKIIWRDTAAWLLRMKIPGKSQRQKRESRSTVFRNTSVGTSNASTIPVAGEHQLVTFLSLAWLFVALRLGPLLLWVLFSACFLVRKINGDVKGWNKEPERYGREAKEVDLVVEIGEDNVTLMIDEKLVAVSRVDFDALQKLIGR